ncbi:uncharacterized protein PG986_013148 [Apiospora aurea]|uniref:Uncharacterized protein n=1 Tax=Apiospora aurea TaxID=335848 RepID=A0ABR1PV92_9PEZI
MDFAKKALGWFDMPGEIRNKIYRDLFIRLNTFEIVGTGLVGNRLYPLLVGLKAVGILYGANTFPFPCPPEYLQGFFETINKANARLMTRVVFPAEHAASYFASPRIGPEHPIFILVKRCQGLRELVFDTIITHQPWRKDRVPNWNPYTPRHWPILFRHLEAISTLERTVVRISHIDYRIYKSMYQRISWNGQEVVHEPIPQLGTGLAKLLSAMHLYTEYMEEKNWAWEMY